LDPNFTEHTNKLHEFTNMLCKYFCEEYTAPCYIRNNYYNPDTPPLMLRELPENNVWTNTC